MPIHGSDLPTPPAPSRRHAWAVATRPHTLGISLAPVFVGTALAWQQAGRFNAFWALLAALVALLLQVGTNLDNDVSDSQRGTDRAGRLGLPRATASGLLSARQVRGASRVCFALAVAGGLLLAWHGGWPILLTGAAAATAAMTYAGGPWPTSYTPLGDLLVWVFFGPVAVCGSAYLQDPHLGAVHWLVATMLGLPASAVLVINNYRDLEPDRAVGKRTLAVWLGPAFSRAEFALLMLLPFVLLPLLAVLIGPAPSLLLPVLALPAALPLVRQIWLETPGPGFNPLLARTARQQVLLSLLLGVALLAARP